MNQINILSRFSGFPKCHRQVFKTKAPIFPTWTINNNVQSLCFTHRQHKHPSCRPCYRHTLYQYAFALKSSELRTKNVLEWLETRILFFVSSSKKLRIKTNYTHSMHKSLMTSFKIHPLPTNNSVDNNFQALCSTSIQHTIERVVDNQQPPRKKKIRKLDETGLDTTNHFVESLPFVHQLRA